MAHFASAGTATLAVGHSFPESSAQLRPENLKKALDLIVDRVDADPKHRETYGSILRLTRGFIDKHLDEEGNARRSVIFMALRSHPNIYEARLIRNTTIHAHGAAVQATLAPDAASLGYLPGGVPVATYLGWPAEGLTPFGSAAGSTGLRLSRTVHTVVGRIIDRLSWCAIGQACEATQNESAATLREALRNGQEDAILVAAEEQARAVSKFMPRVGLPDGPNRWLRAIAVLGAPSDIVGGPPVGAIATFAAGCYAGADFAIDKLTRRWTTFEAGEAFGPYFSTGRNP